MKKLLLLAASSMVANASFGQQKPLANTLDLPARLVNAGNVANRSTANGDTVIRTNIILSGTGADTLTYYGWDSVLPRDSGYVTGYNALGHKAYAELYRINNAGTPDSAISVLGMYTYMYGRANAASVKNVTLTAWSTGPRTQPSPATNPRVYFTGMPNAIIASRTLPLKAFSASATNGGAINTDTILYFTTPSPYISKNFYVGVQLPGYTYSNLGGDTAILISTKDGNRRSNSVGYTTAGTGGTDTTYLMQNVYQESTGAWKDFYWDHPYEMFFHLFAMPVIKIRIPSAVNGITQKDLTVFGTFPNPSISATTFKFSLATAVEARVELMDMTGRKIRVIQDGAFAAGEHNLNVETADLSAGNYLISIRTKNNDGMAIQMTVAK